MAIEEKIVSFEKLSRYDQQIKAYIDHELSQIETGTDTSDATATEDKVFLDETFYAGGQKRTGTFTIQSELDSQDELIASIRSALEGKTAGSGGDTLKTLLDATQRTSSLFALYSGTSVEGLIPYSATENVTDMGNMFGSCKSLTSVPLFDTGKVTNMQSMFSSCKSLTSVSLFNTSNVTDMSYMFNGCKALSEVPQFDTSNVTSMNYMFQSCTSLTAASLPNIKKAKTLYYMFQSCTSLTEVSLFNTSNVTSLEGAFKSCTNLKKVALEKISSKVTSMYQTFYGCSKLELIDFRGATSVPKLSNINGFTNVPSTCKVVIPDALYDTWTNATNWAAINVTWVKESEYTEE